LDVEAVEPVSEPLSLSESESSGEEEIMDSSDMQKARMLVQPEPDSPPYHVPSDEEQEPDEPALTDVLVFNSKSADKKPGKGTQEETKDTYPELAKIKDWRKQLSHFDEAEFECTGSNGIVFPKGSRWKTLEHYWQAAKLSLVDQPFANLLRVGEKYGNGDGNEARSLRKGIAKGPDKHPVILTQDLLSKWDTIMPEVMYVAAKAKFSQNKGKLAILCATKKAALMHLIPRVPKEVSLVRFTHYERIRSELC
jgi:predicted NAD-dependent protein-ADP-ribosyltransferase YbiA (DUF1768 family)